MFDSETEAFVMYVSSIHLIISDISILLIALFNRKKIINFQQNIVSFLLSMFDTSDVTNQTECVEYVKKCSRHVVTLRNFLFPLFIFGTIGMSIDMKFRVPSSTATWRIIAIPFACGFFSSVYSLRSFSRIYVISVLECLTICSKLVEKKVSEGDANSVLEMLQKLENVMLEVNSAYGVCIAVDVLSQLLISITLIFQLIGLTIQLGLQLFMVSYGIELVTNSFILFAYCDVFGRMECHV